MKTILLFLLLLIPAWSQEIIPFQYLPGSDDGIITGHLISVPVTLENNIHSHFILDTGIGVELISKRLAQRLKTPKLHQSYTGKRMSGQAITVPISYLNYFGLGHQEDYYMLCSVMDFKGFLPETPAFADIDGFLSLRFFNRRPFTLDYSKQQLILETPTSLQLRVNNGCIVPLQLDYDQGVPLTAFANLEVVGVDKLKVEIDTGSDSLILHKRFLPDLKLTENDPQLRKVEASDETNFHFTRWFGKLSGDIQLDNQVILKQTNPRIMFQDIIYDGLIGHDYLKHFTVTFDLVNSRMILQPNTLTDTKTH